MSTNTGDESHRINITNGLLLFHNSYSFYSQKVVMALHEKNLPFESQILNILRGDQYEPWFLKINPRGEVPVLQDDTKIIPDSNNIIDYLEDNFSNGDTPRLIPLDQGTEVRQKVIHFRNILDEIPADILTIGSFYHTQFVGTRKIPFILPVRKIMADLQKNLSKSLREYAQENLECREMLLQKANTQESHYSTISTLEKYSKILDHVADVLNEVEEELSKHVEDEWWLCTNRFTIADIALTILLERLNVLGLNKHYWGNDKRPHIQKYFEKVKKRDSYKQTVPSKTVFVKMILGHSPIWLGVGVVALLSVLIGGVFVVKKFIL